MAGFVWLNQRGEYLTVGFHTTHTGKHVDVGSTNDLNKAYVALSLPKDFPNLRSLESSYIPLPAVEKVVRTVLLVTPATGMDLKAEAQ